MRSFTTPSARNVNLLEDLDDPTSAGRGGNGGEARGSGGRERGSSGGKRKGRKSGSPSAAADRRSRASILALFSLILALFSILYVLLYSLIPAPPLSLSDYMLKGACTDRAAHRNHQRRRCSTARLSRSRLYTCTASAHDDRSSCLPPSAASSPTPLGALLVRRNPKP